MHAIVGTSRIDTSRGEEAVTMAQGILAKVKQAPGFVSGAFTRSADGTSGRSMLLFESEEAAKAVAANARTLLGENPPVELVSLDVYEVVANT
jgi:heme-degrading monooxygenase HmoA